ncbi:MAG TPA: 4-alpha-glucanotransferase [Candidatus Acidoferrales bacterium]|nr:4-alpha-glucanotransferase [Candidatus Acidoferrales bacterium]
MIDDRYADAFGNPVTVSDATMAAMRAALGDDDGAAAPVRVVRADRLAQPREIGYYGDLIVVPERAYVPAALDRERAWAIGIQLYSLRSASNDGIGDFGDLSRFATFAGGAGAAAIALNPLHQSHLTNPAAASPYAPLSRRFLNALYIDVHGAAREFGVSIGDLDNRALREATLVDYTGVASLKLEILERCFAACAQRRPWDEFAAGDSGVNDVARYEAIMEMLTDLDPDVYGWQQWPRELQDARGPAVERFAAQHAHRVDFYVFLQWLADRQLEAAARAASEMPLGLYRDLAVGVDLNSADVWSDPGAYVLGLSVGAPPDPLNTSGQNWGLPPFHPRVLRERAYEPFVTLLRANMRHAGALRIDHVMGLQRLFCIPRAYPEGGGAYVRYDFEAMLGIVALESVINRCMIVGEDLGTVPEGFRERTAQSRIFGCSVLQFNLYDDRTDVVATTGTHDLPTFAGWWGTVDGAARERFFHAIRSAGIDVPEDGLTALLVAAYRYLARSRARLVLLQLEDGVGSFDQVNVPGTVDEEPNWQRKIVVPIEALGKDPIFNAILGVLREERPREGGAR